MPAVIMCRSQKPESRPKQKSRQQAAFEFRWKLKSAFRVLLAPPCLVQSDFLSLHFSRIAGHETGGAERAFQSRIILDQRPGDAVAHGAGLAALAAATHVHHDVEARRALGELERLAHHHASGLAAEELVHRLAVHDELAFAGLEEHSRNRALAPSGSVVI